MNDSSWHRGLWALCLMCAALACERSTPNDITDGGTDASTSPMEGGAPDAPSTDARVRYPLSPPGRCVGDDAGRDDVDDTDAGVDPFVRLDWRPACADRCGVLLGGTSHHRVCAVRCEIELEFADRSCGDCYLSNLGADQMDCSQGCGAPDTRVTLTSQPLWACASCAETLERVTEARCGVPSRTFVGQPADRERTVDEPLRLKAVGNDVVGFGVDGLFVVQDDLSLTSIGGVDSLGHVEDIVQRADGVWVAYVFDALTAAAELVELNRDGTILRRVPTVTVGVPPIRLAAAPSGLIAATSTQVDYYPSVYAIDPDGASTVLNDDLANSVAFDVNGDWLLVTTRPSGMPYATEVRHFSEDRTTGAWSLASITSIDTPRSRPAFEQHLAIDADGRRVLFHQFDPGEAYAPRIALSAYAVDGSPVWSIEPVWGQGEPLIAPNNAIVLGTSAAAEGAGFVVFNADGSERFRYSERGPIDEASIAVDPDGYVLLAIVTRAQTDAANVTYPAQPRLLRFSL